MTESELKRRLHEISQKGKINALEVEELIPHMLESIGSPDSELRDELIYEHLSNWIMDKNLIHQRTCRRILNVITDDAHLFLGIGEKDTDSVFTRSFSILLIPALLVSHQSSPYLSTKELQQVSAKLHHYIRLEVDRRGCVEGKGWAHAVAHYADAVNSLVKCEELQEVEIVEALNSLKDVIVFDQLPYGYGEEERLVTPILSLLMRKRISHTQIMRWITDLGKEVLSEQKAPQKMIRRENSKRFLQSLYFRLKWNHGDDDILREIDQVLQEINPLLKMNRECGGP